MARYTPSPPPAGLEWAERTSTGDTQCEYGLEYIRMQLESPPRLTRGRARRAERRTATEGVER